MPPAIAITIASNWGSGIGSSNVTDTSVCRYLLKLIVLTARCRCSDLKCMRRWDSLPNGFSTVTSKTTLAECASFLTVIKWFSSAVLFIHEINPTIDETTNRALIHGPSQPNTTSRRVTTVEQQPLRRIKTAGNVRPRSRRPASKSYTPLYLLSIANWVSRYCLPSYFSICQDRYKN